MYNPITEDKRTSIIGLVGAIGNLLAMYGMGIPIDLKDWIVSGAILALGLFSTGADPNK